MGISWVLSTDLNRIGLCRASHVANTRDDKIGTKALSGWGDDVAYGTLLLRIKRERFVIRPVDQQLPIDKLIGLGVSKEPNDCLLLVHDSLRS
jgi:hypothetical protein